MPNEWIGLIEFGRARNQLLERRCFDLRRVHAKISQFFSQCARLDTRCGNRPLVRRGVRRGHAEKIRDHRAANRFGRMTCLPPANDAGSAGLRKQYSIVLCIGATACRPAGCRIDRAAARQNQSRHAYAAFSRRDARPENRRKHRRERCEITDHAAVDGPLKVRHQTCVEHWMDDLPIRCIPPDESKDARICDSRHLAIIKQKTRADYLHGSLKSPTRAKSSRFTFAPRANANSTCSHHAHERECRWLRNPGKNSRA